MHDFSAATIKKMVIHYVGNKGLNERLVLSDHHVRSLAVEEEEILNRYFLKSFQNDEYHSFSHHTDLEMNEVYNYAHELFLTSVNFIEASKKLAAHLFESTIHPRIKGGEFYVLAFDDVVYDGEVVQAVGLYKSEQKSMFMSVEQGEETFDISLDRGIDIKKLDKGCIVFNVKPDEGFVVLTHDQLSKGDEAQYWKDDFLGVKAVSTEFSMTKNYMSMCKSFVMERLPEEFEIDRTVQIELLNRSSGYFKESEEIDTQEFARNVLEQPEIVESFQAYKQQYATANDIEIEDHFAASKPAVKQNTKFFKSVLKLDKNFHIYVHGNRDLIEHGFDEERGMKFYKVFYNEEKS
ncbi:MAG: nucleoid-associated protein [Flavobacteriales bacterium]